MLIPGGLYVIDDILTQPNWPEGHAVKALIELLENRTDFHLTKLNWSTGVIIMYPSEELHLDELCFMS